MALLPVYTDYKTWLRHSTDAADLRHAFMLYDRMPPTVGPRVFRVLYDISKERWDDYQRRLTRAVRGLDGDVHGRNVLALRPESG